MPTEAKRQTPWTEGESLIGYKWGWMEVIAKADRPEGKEIKFRGTWWLCRCKCGTEKVLPRQYITSKQASSCGCKRRPAKAQAETPAQQKTEIKLSKQDAINLGAMTIARRCKRCGKRFEQIGKTWKYQENGKDYYCNWSCYRGEDGIKPKMTLTERARLQSEAAL